MSLFVHIQCHTIQKYTHIDRETHERFCIYPSSHRVQNSNAYIIEKKKICQLDDKIFVISDYVVNRRVGKLNGQARATVCKNSKFFSTVNKVLRFLSNGNTILANAI